MCSQEVGVELCSDIETKSYTVLQKLRELWYNYFFDEKENNTTNSTNLTSYSLFVMRDVDRAIPSPATKFITSFDHNDSQNK